MGSNLGCFVGRRPGNSTGLKGGDLEDKDLVGSKSTSIMGNMARIDGEQINLHARNGESPIIEDIAPKTPSKLLAG